MNQKKEKWPKELRKDTPKGTLLEFKALKLNMECMSNLINSNRNFTESGLSLEAYKALTDKGQLQKFKDLHQRILSKYGV